MAFEEEIAELESQIESVKSEAISALQTKEGSRQKTVATLQETIGSLEEHLGAEKVRTSHLAIMSDTISFGSAEFESLFGDDGLQQQRMETVETLNGLIAAPGSGDLDFDLVNQSY
jgi:acetyl-CoA carboxylase alpha subunit